MFNFSYNLQSYPWGSYLIYENLGVRNALFSPKEKWPEKLDAFHICVRIIVLEQQQLIEPLKNIYGSINEGYAAVAEYYELKPKTIENNYGQAYQQLKISPGERSSQRNTQLNTVKSWLERDGYFKVAKTIKV